MKTTKAILTAMVVIGLFFTLYGCADKAQNNAETDLPHTDTSGTDITETDSLDTDRSVTEIAYEDGWLQKYLSETNNEKLSVGAEVVIDGDEKSAGKRLAYILHDFANYGDDSVYHDSYLAVETGERVFIVSLATESYKGSYADNIYAVDTDGDGYSEIVLQQAVGVSGGAGQFLSRVYDIDNGIREVFAYYQGHSYDTGFSFVLTDGFKLKAENRFTGYVKEIDLSSKYTGVYFDENGKLIKEDDVMSDSFREFVPEDADGDGVYEISCLQYLSLYDHSDYIGDARIVLKFNSSTQTFDVVQSEFIRNDEFS